MKTSEGSNSAAVDSGNQKNPVNPVSSLPNSKKIYVSGKIHPEIRVPFREISLAPTKTMLGEIEVNEPVRVYDTSGPWGDETFQGNVENGLPPLRAKWIRDRRDVDEIPGRASSPQDDGYLSEVHRGSGNGRYGSKKDKLRSKKLRSMPKPLRAAAGHPVTQLWYARKGIVTPEMEYIAIRENLGRANLKSKIENRKSE